MKEYFFLVLLFILGGCANPNIVQISPDTYMLFREDHAGIFGSSSSLKAGVISDANEFAAKQGKVAVPISSNETPMGVMGQWAKFEYQFRVVDKNDVEACRTSLVPRPDIVIDKSEKISTDIHSKDTSEKKPDLFTELTKLDDLRKRGIITEAEFAAQKKKLLNEQQ